MSTEKTIKKERRKKRIRSKIYGTFACPRLSVFRSGRHIYAQAINDKEQATIFAVSDKEVKNEINAKKTKTDIANKVGFLCAQKAAKHKIKKVVFDRNGYKYHGRIKALAEGAREGGLNF